VKYLFYSLLVIASAATAVCITQPQFAEQCAAKAGWKIQLQKQTSPENSQNGDDAEDRLSQFLAQYPFAKNPQRQNTQAVEAAPVQVSAPIGLPPQYEPVRSEPVHNELPRQESAAAEPAGAGTWEGIEAATPPVHHSEPSPVPALQATSLRSDTENWDGSVTVPVTTVQTPPVLHDDPFLTSPAAAPQVSVYEQLPAQTPPERANAAAPAGRTSPPMPQPSQAAIEYSVETIPCHGAEIAARVGTQVIMVCDILPRLRRFAMKVLNDNISKMTEEERQKIPPNEKEKFIVSFIKSQYAAFLEEQISVALIYNDYAMSKSQEEREGLDRRLGEAFDQTEVSEMMKEFGVNDMASLKTYLQEQLGSSLERERMLWSRDRIAQQWLSASVQHANGECTYEQLRQYYDAHIAEFSSESRAKWQEMVVLFSKYATEDEALRKIQWMGNQAAGGAPFEEIAKANSDGFTASKGGLYDWTTKGSIASPELEQAVFSQPIGQLSPAIIRTDKGFHIVRVTERKEANVVPFIDAQVKIRERIKSQRHQQYQQEYFAQLRRRYPSIVVKDSIDFALGTKTSSLR
jgi:parvulin-like peptidyl-prolyl isomerase